MAITSTILASIHEGLASAILKRLNDGTATAADLNVARQFLKDNGIDAVPAPESPLVAIKQSLPFLDAEGAEEALYN